ncbi:hypothetical protein [Haloactinospora alba]|uniref:hypothetical protein n=1 Tax=Haloactinospora alba TaxID=405555 RepID=UPI001FE9121D|nr:hypothetical protein [Haloactinospora alba]
MGALNVWGNSLPSETMPHEQITVDGVPFSVSPATGEAPDNIRCAGQYLELPETAADWLHLLATSERRCEETVHIHYSSGAADRERLRVSDFLPARSHFGELLAARSPAMHYPHHRQDNLSGQIWAVRVPVTRRETLRGFRLPDNPAIHIFALSTEEVR